jgi:hypothetical protein
MIRSYRAYLWSSPPTSQLAMVVTTLIVIGSIVPFADLVVAPLLIYAGLQIRAQRPVDRAIRLIGQAAAGMGLVMGVLALWSLLSLAELFVPTSLGG